MSAAYGVLSDPARRRATTIAPRPPRRRRRRPLRPRRPPVGRVHLYRVACAGRCGAGSPWCSSASWPRSGWCPSSGTTPTSGPAALRPSRRFVDVDGEHRLAFTTRAGQRVEAVEATKSGEQQPAVGSRVRIHYDRDDPTTIVTDVSHTGRDITLWIVAVKLIVGGAVSRSAPGGSAGSIRACLRRLKYCRMCKLWWDGLRGPARRARAGRRRGRVSHRQVLVVLSGVMLGMGLAALDQTVVATALPTIVGDLGGLEQLSWVVTAYLLTQTIAHAALREARRPLRPQVDLPARDLGVRARQRARRPVGHDAPTHRLPGAAGLRRGRADHRGPGDHRRRRQPP